MLDVGISDAEHDAVDAEDSRQIHKWGYQDVPPQNWLGYLTEEVGELAEAINKTYTPYDKEGVAKVDIYKEAIQVATLALKIARMHRRNG